MAMTLGGAAPRTIDPDHFAIRASGGTPLQRANELLLRVGCIAEAFSGGTATVSLAATSHDLPRAIYDKILRDETRHRRLGGLYFEWAYSRIDDDERHRLGRVMLRALQGLAPFWQSPAGKLSPTPPLSHDDLRALGWLAPTEFGPIARNVVVRDILDPLAKIGIVISPEERVALLA